MNDDRDSARMTRDLPNGEVRETGMRPPVKRPSRNIFQSSIIFLIILYRRISKKISPRRQGIGLIVILVFFGIAYATNYWDTGKPGSVFARIYLGGSNAYNGTFPVRLSKDPTQILPGEVKKDENYFAQNGYSTKRVSRSDASVAVSATVPVVNNEQLDAYILLATQTFLQSLAPEVLTQPIEYSFASHAYDDYLFIVIHGDVGTAAGKKFTVIGISSKGPINYSELFSEGYESIIAESVAKTLGERYKVERSKGVELALEALRAHAYRLAVNGVVVLIPMDKLAPNAPGVSYHEVLVPNAELSGYIEY
jgi:hypothetical protein